MHITYHSSNYNIVKGILALVNQHTYIVYAVMFFFSFAHSLLEDRTKIHLKHLEE